MITRTPNPDCWLTSKDIAREMGLHILTVQRYIRDGRLPGAKFGNAYLISREQWDAFRAGEWTPKATPTAPPKPVDLIARRSA